MYAKPGAKSLRARLAEGERLIGTWATIRSVATVEMLAELPFDFVVIDLQHGEFGVQDVLQIAPAFRSANAAPVIRMLDHSASNIGRILDFGIENIIVPTVGAAAIARVCIDATAYPPAGFRSFGPFRSSCYGVREASIAHCPDRMMGAQIETKEGWENIDAILDTPNLGMAFVGPYDLRTSLGLSSFDELEPVVKQIAAKCRARKIPYGTMAVTLSDATRWLDLGAQFISVGVDMDTLRTGAQAMESAVARYRGQK